MFETGFALDPRIETASALVADWPLCQVRLKDDARFPWLLLVPRRPDVVELADLANEYPTLCAEILRASRVLQVAAKPEKLNVATLGNVVPQLHVHVIARLRDDPAWPDPVWCLGPGPAYGSAERAAMVERLRAADAAPAG